MAVFQPSNLIGKPIGIMEVRAALNDDRFVALFPELKHEIDKYLKDAKCSACAVPVVKEILNKYPDKVEQYFPGRRVIRPVDEAKKLAENNWTVINCKVDELEDKLRGLPPGRKQIAVARYENEVTVIINGVQAIF